MTKPQGLALSIHLYKPASSGQFLKKEIKYNVPTSAAYYPGEVVSGNIVVDRTDSLVDIVSSSILLSFQGKADVHIVTNRHIISSDSATAINYEGYLGLAQYFNEEKIPVATNVKVPLGVTKYPFSFTLPEDNIAPSFTGRHGDIFYGIEARLAVLGYEDVVAVAAYTVLGKLCIDDVSWANEPFEIDVAKHICCTCSSGPLNIHCSFLKAGFIPGDNIDLCITIINNTSRRVKRVFAQFSQKVRYQAGEYIKEEVKPLEEKLLQGFTGNRMECRKDRLFVVPKIQPTLTWGIIQISYCVHFIFDISRTNNLKLDCPVIIGTYRKAKK